MMELHDELMTPGCPQCAVKHLSAALYHKAQMKPNEAGVRPDSYIVDVCTAYINLVEVKAGYRSHLWYAVGALVRAEERAAVRSGACAARAARLLLEEHGENAIPEVLEFLSVKAVPFHADWAAAHLSEAKRELPAFAARMTMDDLPGAIEEIRREYFILDEVPVASPEDVGKGGEADMATKKAAKKAPAFLKKEDPKAKKAACKGGKCKGKCK